MHTITDIHRHQKDEPRPQNLIALVLTYNNRSLLYSPAHSLAEKGRSTASRAFFLESHISVLHWSRWQNRRDAPGKAYEIRNTSHEPLRLMAVLAQHLPTNMPCARPFRRLSTRSARTRPGCRGDQRNWVTQRSWPCGPFPGIRNREASAAHGQRQHGGLTMTSLAAPP